MLYSVKFRYRVIVQDALSVAVAEVALCAWAGADAPAERSPARQVQVSILARARVRTLNKKIIEIAREHFIYVCKHISIEDFAPSWAKIEFP